MATRFDKMNITDQFLIRMEMKRKQSYSSKHGWFAISIICLGMSTLLCFAITSVQYRWQSSQNANKFIQHLYKSVSHAKPIFEQSLSGFIRIDLGTEPHKDVLQASNEVDELLMDAEESPTDERTRQNEKDHLENLNTRDGHGNTSSNGVDDSIPEEHEVNMVEQTCDFSSGKWVYDESYPLYGSSCPFLDEAFRCQDNGRPDRHYMKWRWKPAECEIPRFNATDMLLRMSGKRVVFVGDSIARNQWESLVCMLAEAVPDKEKVYEVRGQPITKQRGDYVVKFENYKLRVEFYRSHFLVQEGKKPPGSPKKVLSSLIVDKMDKTVTKWVGANVLVFNTGHWWNHAKLKRGRCYFQEGDKLFPNMNVMIAYEKAISAWGDWINSFVDPASSHVFFRSYSPAHFHGGQWNTGGKCHTESDPIMDETFVVEYPAERVQIVEKVIQRMRVPATYLNITILSGYRKDGHPSIWRRHDLKNLKSASAIRRQDCSHWCLPGVPDTWNHLLYASLVQKDIKSRLLAN